MLIRWYFTGQLAQTECCIDFVSPVIHSFLICMFDVQQTAVQLPHPKAFGYSDSYKLQLAFDSAPAMPPRPSRLLWLPLTCLWDVACVSRPLPDG